MENPSNAVAVNKQLNKVSFPVPNHWIILPLARLEAIVPPAMTIATSPADPMEESISGQITGHAAPNNESGRPRLINAK
ncbi:hypothetical protein PA598K_06791 [Paenibacillus sp. 598K]|nr:hypothetical protein PA598K_06791 [Paenibacillus sp. 598K]